MSSFPQALSDINHFNTFFSPSAVVGSILNVTSANSGMAGKLITSSSAIDWGITAY
jgi:hypothetical protein